MQNHSMQNNWTQKIKQKKKSTETSEKSTANKYLLEPGGDDSVGCASTLVVFPNGCIRNEMVFINIFK